MDHHHRQSKTTTHLLGDFKSAGVDNKDDGNVSVSDVAVTLQRSPTLRHIVQHIIRLRRLDSSVRMQSPRETSEKELLSSIVQRQR